MTLIALSSVVEASQVLEESSSGDKGRLTDVGKGLNILSLGGLTHNSN